MPDIKEWLELVKGITPLKEKSFIAKPSKKIKIKSSIDDAPSISSAANGVDGSTQKKFNKEKFEIEATLDLHGYTYDTAFDAVINFITRSYNQKKRCIIIITGKGEVLKDALPKWLEHQSIRNIILQKKHPSNSLGGGGAFMILLRRART